MLLAEPTNRWMLIDLIQKEYHLITSTASLLRQLKQKNKPLFINELTHNYLNVILMRSKITNFTAKILKNIKI